MSMPVPLQVQQAYDLSGTMRLFLVTVVHLLFGDRSSMSRPPPAVGGRMQNRLPGRENPESIAGGARASFVNVALADLPDAMLAPADASALGADQRLGDALIKSSHGFHLSFVSWCSLLPGAAAEAAATAHVGCACVEFAFPLAPSARLLIVGRCGTPMFAGHARHLLLH
ncbi:hypothetical protein [Nonomuraea fuscirosea]|uniref:hypothetical protein n=1 Tax=Nonomuraea fuscirosea TaxID=1291556 RepID=UPI0033CC0AD4